MMRLLHLLAVVMSLVGQGAASVQESAPFFADSLFYSWQHLTRNVSCHALGEPAPLINWIHNGQVLYDNETYHIYASTYISTLAITNRPQDQPWIYGEYVCRAINRHGAAERALLLRRGTVPDPPASVTVSASTAVSITLQVAPPASDGGMYISKYRVEYDDRSQDFDVTEADLTEEWFEIRLEHLRPATRYDFRIRAGNEFGAGVYYELSHTTDEIRVPGPVEITSDADGVYPDRYTVTWAEPDSGGLRIRGYKIRFCRVEMRDNEMVKPLDGWTVFVRSNDPASPLTEFTLLNLMENQTYQVEVTAWNDLGWSEPHPETVFTTAAAAN